MADSIRFLGEIGRNSAPSGGTTLVITVGQAVPAGSCVIVCCGRTTNSIALSSVTDSRSNTYAIDVTRTSSSGARSGNIARSIISTALQVDDTITLTFGSSVSSMGAVAMAFSGIASSPFDVSASDDAGTGTTASSGDVPTPAESYELQIGLVFESGGSSDTFTATESWNARSRLHWDQGGGVNRAVNAMWRVVSSKEAVAGWRANGTLNTSRAWMAAIGTYKASVVPSPPSPVRLDFDGASSYGTVTDAATNRVHTNNAFTWALWVRFDSYNNNLLPRLMNKGVHYACIMGDSGNARYRNFGLETVDQTDSASEYWGNTKVETGVWYHVVFTFDGDVTGGECARFFINGQRENIHEIFLWDDGDDLKANTSPLLVARRPSDLNRNLDGQIAGPIVMYQRAVTDSEAFDIFDGSPPSGYTMFVPATEGGGTTAYDSTANGNDIVLTDVSWVVPSREPLGWFDHELRDTTQFDPEAVIEGWFDRELIAAAAAGGVSQIALMPIDVAAVRTQAAAEAWETLVARAITAGEPFEAQTGRSRTTGLDWDALASRATSALSPWEAPASVSQHAGQPYETQSSAGANALSPYETQAARAAAAALPFETLAILAPTKVVPWEALASRTPVAATPWENLVTAAADGLFPIETMQSIVPIVLVPWEARGTVAAATAPLPVEVQAAAASLAAVPWSSLAATTALALAHYESLLTAADQASAPYETLAARTAAASVPWSSLVGITATRAKPYEALASRSTSTLTPWESAGGTLVSQTGLVPYEALATVAQTGGLPVEALVVRAATSLLPVEALLLTAATAGQPVETHTGLAALVILPFEAPAGRASPVVLPYETLLGLAASGLLPWESLFGGAAIRSPWAAALITRTSTGAALASRMAGGLIVILRAPGDATLDTDP